MTPAQQATPRPVVRIGNGQGFMGESLELMQAVLDDGVDYLVCESLAERTMAILEQERQRDETAGFARDLADRVELVAPYVFADSPQEHTRFITNAGGVNPVAAHRAVVARLKSAGWQGRKIGIVLNEAPELAAPHDETVLATSVYLGAAGIVRALDQGADIVITGRVADACLFLAPLIHEFGWCWDDWDRLAAGAVAGHLLECSAQSTGGNYSGDWWNVFDPARMGLPIAEVDATGHTIVTKPKGSAGRVSFDTVREQLLYEVHDPAAYITPDVVVDMTTVCLRDLGDDRVEVTGTRGNARPDTLKGFTFAPAGYSGESVVTYSWPDAEAKARVVLDFIRTEATRRGHSVHEWCEEFFGVRGFGGVTVEDTDRHEDPPEVTARLAWRTDDRATAQSISQLVGLIALTGPPGLHGIGRRRPADVTQLIDLQPFLVAREDIESRVHVHVEEI